MKIDRTKLVAPPSLSQVGGGGGAPVSFDRRQCVSKILPARGSTALFTCAQKLTNSQLNLPHGTNKKE